MKNLLLLAAFTLCGCSDFVQGFNDGYARAHNSGVGDAVARFAQGYADGVASYQAPPQPLYHTGLITGGGQPPQIYSVGPYGGLITGGNHPPIIISGY